MHSVMFQFVALRHVSTRAAMLVKKASYVVLGCFRGGNGTDLSSFASTDAATVLNCI